MNDRGDQLARLLVLGREREAAAMGAVAPIETNGGTMDVLHQFELVGPALGGVVAGITPDQLDNATPCAKFTVRGVLEHMIGGATVFAAAFRGEEAPAEPDVTDPLGAFGPCLGGLVAAISQPGALDRTVESPGGPMPARDFAQFIVLDGTVHGWDMATATGQVYDPDPALVELLLGFAGPALEGMRDGDTFAEATEAPPGATPIQRLAALTGRTVA